MAKVKVFVYRRRQKDNNDDTAADAGAMTIVLRTFVMANQKAKTKVSLQRPSRSYL